MSMGTQLPHKGHSSPHFSAHVLWPNGPKLEYAPMTNVMAALPNIGGALCATAQSLADVHVTMPLGTEATLC